MDELEGNQTISELCTKLNTNLQEIETVFQKYSDSTTMLGTKIVNENIDKTDFDKSPQEESSSSAKKEKVLVQDIKDNNCSSIRSGSPTKKYDTQSDECFSETFFSSSEVPPKCSDYNLIDSDLPSISSIRPLECTDSTFENSERPLKKTAIPVMRSGFARNAQLTKDYNTFSTSALPTLMKTYSCAYNAGPAMKNTDPTALCNDLTSQCTEGFSPITEEISVCDFTRETAVDIPSERTIVLSKKAEVTDVAYDSNRAHLVPKKSSAKKFAGSKFAETAGPGCYDCENPCGAVVSEVCGVKNIYKDAYVDWRLCHEATMASLAYKKFIEEQENKPQVELPPGEKETDFRLAQSVYSSWSVSQPDIIRSQILQKVSSVIPDENFVQKFYELLDIKERCSKTEPLVKEPPIPKFPLTRETKKKHIEKETVLKKGEKREAVLMLEKKQEDLRKLKGEFKRQTQKHFCHKEQRVAEYEKKKLEYLEKLATERNIDLEILKKHGDDIYKKYRKECKMIEDMREKKLEEEIAIIEKLLREEKLKQTQQENAEYRKEKERFSEVARERQILEKTLHQNQDEKAYKTGSSLEAPVEIDLPSKVLRLKLPKEKTSKDKKKSRLGKIRLSLPKKMNLGKRKPLVEKHLGKEEQKQLKKKDDVRQEKWTGFYRRRLSQMIRRFSQYKLPEKESVKISNRHLQCNMQWLNEIQDMLSEFENKIDFIPNYKEELDIGVSPQSVTFHDFFPTQTQLQEVTLYNRTNHKIHCGLFKILTKPFQSKRIIEVWPPEVIKLWPGQCSKLEIIFSPIIWGTTNQITSDIWYWTRHHKGEKRKFLIKVECLRANSNPNVLTREIEFSDVDWWNENVFSKNLIIENRGALACTVYIHRSFEMAPAPSPDDSPILSKVSSPRQKSLTGLKNIKKDKKKYIRDGKSNHSLRATSSFAIKLRSLDLEKINNTNYMQRLLDVVLEEVHSPFRIYLSRGKQIKGYSTMSIPVRFLPLMLENGQVFAQDFIRVSFEGYDHSSIKEEIVTFYGSLKQAPIEVIPPTLDMSMLLIGGGMRQTSFSVMNMTDKFLEVQVTLPRELSPHFQCLPTTVKLRPRSESAVVLRANLGFYDDADNYISSDTHILEFNLFIHPERYAPIEVLVLASLSDLLGLVVEPSVLDLGVVNTCETAVADIWVHNLSMTPQDIAFLNLPKWGLIMPDNGYSQIGPMGKRKFEIMYSPTFTEAGKVGGQAEHTFNIKVTTAHAVSRIQDMKILHIEEQVTPITEERLANIRSPLKEDDIAAITPPKETQQRESHQGETPVLGENLGEEEVQEEFSDSTEDDKFTFLFMELSEYPIVQKKDTTEEGKPHKSNSKKTKIKTDGPMKPSEGNPPSHQSNCQKKNSEILEEKLTISHAEEELFPEVELQKPPCTNLYSSIQCKAIVVDPLCQLSHQQIVLPATPVTSFSITKIYLSCPSKLGGPSCDCGVFKGLEDDPRSKVTARFEIFCSDPFLQFEPTAGELSYNEKIALYIYFKPELTLEELQNEEELYKLERKKKNKQLKKPQKNDKFLMKTSLPGVRRNTPAGLSVINLEKVIDVDIWNKLRMETLKNIKPALNTSRIQCLIETKMIEEPFTKRREVLNCIVECPVIKPDFYVKTSRQEHIINFPPLAVGLKKEENLEIHNISGKTIFLTRNLLDVEDNLYTTMIPNYSSALPHGKNRGLMLEPEECLKMKVIFSPQYPGKISEILEFKSNLTTVQCKLTGEAKEPSFRITPATRLITMDAYPGQKTEQKIMVYELNKLVPSGMPELSFLSLEIRKAKNGAYCLKSYTTLQKEWVTNTGEVPLIFNITSSDKRESFNFWLDHPDVQSILFHKPGFPKEREHHIPNTPIVSDEWLTRVLENLFSPSQRPNPISIEAEKFKIESGGKFEVKISFHPPIRCSLKKTESPDISETKFISETTLINTNLPPHIWNTNGYDLSLPTAYKKTITLTIGNNNIVSSWIVLGFIKRKKDHRSQKQVFRTKASSFKHTGKGRTVREATTPSSAASSKSDRSHLHDGLRKNENSIGSLIIEETFEMEGCLENILSQELTTPGVEDHNKSFDFRSGICALTSTLNNSQTSDITENSREKRLSSVE